MTTRKRADNFATELQHKFTANLPLFSASDSNSIKAEIKPYLQPFERLLAERELRALLAATDSVVEEHGLFVVTTNVDEEFLRERLTYWQRLGRAELVPTRQCLIELTQSGADALSKRAEMHRARRLRYGPHDLHEYRGKFFPQLVRSLITISGVDDNRIVIDPMCGSGTTICESVAFGHDAVGADLNPLSVLISRTKTGLATEAPAEFANRIKRYLGEFRFARLAPALQWEAADVEYLIRWFDPIALEELAGVLSDIDKVKSRTSRDFLRVCLSNIVRNVSWQKGDDLRVRKEIKPIDAGTVFESFQAEVSEQLDRLLPYLSVVRHRVLQPKYSIVHGDATQIHKLLPEFVGQCGLLVTSPPYATALPYLDTDRLSLIVLKLLGRRNHRAIETSMIGTREVTEAQRKAWWELYCSKKKDLPNGVQKLIDRIAKNNHAGGVGFRRRNLPALLGKYFLDMTDAMKSAHQMMAEGSPAYYVVGNNSTMLGDVRVEIPTDTLLFEVGERAGWTAVNKLPMELIPSRDIFRENRGTTEMILELKA